VVIYYTVIYFLTLRCKPFGQTGLKLLFNRFWFPFDEFYPVFRLLSLLFFGPKE
jgi:hypothetical protein